MKKDIVCPQCGKKTVYAEENSYRPFCSERCRIIDLGDWASEKYAIPVNPDEKSSEILEEDDTQTTNNGDK